MEWNNADWFFLGLVIGYIIFPIWQAIGLILTNAWHATTACNNDCNQGRNCTCKGKKDV